MRKLARLPLLRIFALALCGFFHSVASAKSLSREPQRILYQVYVESFKDGVLGDGGGDFTGLGSKLDYLKDLGIGALLLMPIFKGDGMGYIAHDFWEIRRDYSGATARESSYAALRDLIAAAHARDIQVHIDFPLNHIWVGSDWFKRSSSSESGFENWFLWAPRPVAGWRLPWREDSVPDDVWHSDPGSQKFYYGLFGSGIADINHGWPAVRAEMDRLFEMYLSLGVDGFRIDAAKHLLEGHDHNLNEVLPANRDLISGYFERARAKHPDVSFTLENWSGYEVIDFYLPRAGDLAFDFPYMHGLRDALKHGHHGSLRDALTHISRSQSTIATHNRISFMGNHDVPRIRTEVDGNIDKIELGMALTLSLPMLPMIYYGDEIFTPGRYVRKSDGDINEVCTPMAWNNQKNAGFADPSFNLGEGWNKKIHSDFATYNVASELLKPKGLLSRIKALTRLRKQLPIDDKSQLWVDENGDRPLITFSTRYSDGTCSVAVFNFSAQTQDGIFLGSKPLCDLEKLYTRELVASKAERWGLWTKIQPYGYVILRGENR